MYISESTNFKGPVLVIAAHPDDEVLGCGGTIDKLIKAGIEVHCILCTQGITSRHGQSESEKKLKIEKLKLSSRESHKLLGVTSTHYLDFPDNKMDILPLLDVIQEFEKLIESIQPFSVITHSKNDVNIDHQIVHEAVQAATRPQPNMPVRKLLFFEIPSSSEWRFSGKSDVFTPSVFMDIEKNIANKIKALKCYDSEMRNFPHPRSYESVENLSKFRGATVGLFYAEAFELGRDIYK
jgi:LmbE family N-acetylglucosaminyl deacetylase